MKVTAWKLYDPAMQIKTQEEAERYFEKLVRRNMQEAGNDRAQAEKIERENLGYWAGYGSLETRARVERLYKAYHPVLPPADQPQPTIAELLQLGWEFARSGEPFPWPRREGPFE